MMSRSTGERRSTRIEEDGRFWGGASSAGGLPSRARRSVPLRSVPLRRGRVVLAAALASALAAAVGACASQETQETTTGSSGAGGSGGATACMPGSKIACYTGPLKTQDVGTCKGGQRTCNAEGSAYGICEGEVTPAMDDCATPEDEDCDGTPAPACPGTHLFSRAIGGTLDDQGLGIAMDGTGAMLLTGFFSGQKGMKSADFGGGALTSGGGRDLYIAKFDASGAHVWSKGFGDDANQEGSAIAVDASEAVFVTGAFDGTLDFSGGKSLTSKDTRDAFVVKLGPNGDAQWANAYGDAAGAQQGTGIAADATGAVLVAGAFAGTVDFGLGPMTSAGGLDIFVAKLDGVTGTAQWAKRFGDAMDQNPRAIAVDAQGNIVITGNFNGSVDFGTGALTGAGGNDVFVVKLDPQGMALYSQRYGDAMDQAGQAVAIDASGAALIAGTFKGSIDAGGGELASAGAEDLFLVKLDAAGAHQWSKRFGDSASQVLGGVALDGAGNIALTGKFMGSLDFGQKPVLPSTEVYDVFVVKLDPMAAHLWSRAYGGAFDQIGAGIAASASGDVAITGTFFGSIDFVGGDPKPSAGLSDLFFARFAP